jgi:hypothetical protein
MPHASSNCRLLEIQLAAQVTCPFPSNHRTHRSQIAAHLSSMASPFPTAPAVSGSRNIRTGIELKDFRKEHADGKM